MEKSFSVAPDLTKRLSQPVSVLSLAAFLRGSPFGFTKTAENRQKRSAFGCFYEYLHCKAPIGSLPKAPGLQYPSGILPACTRSVSA